MPQSKKLRLDQTLVVRGLARSRAQANGLIIAGKVFAGETCLNKAGHFIGDDINITVRGPVHPWVSRGGIKLNHALDHFQINPTGAIAFDVGASTGGFTDVLLSKGAKKVYAIDVGYGQLDWKLRCDKRVVVLEKTNARYLNSDLIKDPISIIVCDASFIGLEKILPAPLSYVSESAYLVALIKPQFEVGPEQLSKGGVVRDPVLHSKVSNRIEGWLNSMRNWSVLGVTESPITGPKGNKEFLIAAHRTGE